MRARWEHDPDPDPSYLEQPEFADRLTAYHRGEFGYVGCWAEVTIIVAGTVQTIRSGGLWGIESDSDDDYRASIEHEQRGDLRSILVALGVGDDDLRGANT